MRRVVILRSLTLALLGCAMVLSFVGSSHDLGAGLRRLTIVSALLAAAVLLARGRLRDVALMAASLCVGFTAAEAIVLLRERPKPMWVDNGLQQPRPFVGFGPTRAGAYAVRKIAPDGHMIFDAVATIGDDLLRVTQAPKGEGAIAFFGDSFTFGAGVEDKDTIAQAFADLTGRSLPVPNMSFSAWSPAQNLAELQHGFNADQLRHPRHFVLMTAPWHVERTACKIDFARGTPRYRLAGGTLELQGACFMPGRLHKFLIGFALYRSLVQPYVEILTKADIDSYFAIIDAFVATAKEQSGVGTTILVTPAAEYADERLGMSEVTFERRLARSGADIVVDPLPLHDSRYTIPEDTHPTALANRLKAKLLLDRLAETLPGLRPALKQQTDAPRLGPASPDAAAGLP